MPSLLDTIDRLTYTANSLHSIATSSRTDDAGSLTQAMLHSSLQDILREADETEYGLFHFVGQSNNTTTLGQGTLGRREYKTATPLRTRRIAGKTTDEDPEVYLEAALRYLGRFHSIKPMPGTRTHLESLIERLDKARKQLKDLQGSMQEDEKRRTPTHQIQQEEKKVKELKVQLLQLKKKRDTLSETLNAKAKQRAPPKSKIIASSSLQSPSFPALGDQSMLAWSAAKPFVGDDKPNSLLEEELDLVGMISVDERDGDRVSDSDDPTIVVSGFKKDQEVHIENEPARIFSPSTPECHSPNPSLFVPQIPIQETRISDPPPTKMKPQQTPSTPEMDRICIKIWGAVADILLPGNNFSQTGKIPNTKDTLTILEAISSQQISEDNPSVSSTCSSPSARSTLSSILGIELHPPPTGASHQILTALLLFNLLMSPNHSIPLNHLKVQLATKISNSSSERPKHATAAALGASSIGSRAIYGCVAKKIIKIDRGGGEQIVKFD